MVPEKYVERTMIGIFNMIQFEDFSSDISITVDKGNNDVASLWGISGQGWYVSRYYPQRENTNIRVDSELVVIPSVMQITSQK